MKRKGDDDDEIRPPPPGVQFYISKFKSPHFMEEKAKRDST